VAEYKEVMAQIADLLDILARPERVTAIIADELSAIKMQFGDPRRSEIVLNTADINIEDLIAREDMVVTLSHGGYFKRQPLADYRAQKRGGRGKQAAAMKEDDFVDRLFIANTHDYILCFSNRGRAYWLKVYEVPEGNRTARGKPIVNLFPLVEGEKITTVLPVKEFDDEHFIFMATAMGTVKKTPLKAFANPRKAGIIAAHLDDGDHLIGVAITNGQCDVMLFSDAGKAVRFDENDVRPMGRESRGVKGMQLENCQNLIAMLVAKQHETEVAHRKAKDAVDALQAQIKEKDAESDKEELKRLSAKLDELKELVASAEKEMEEALANIPKETLPSILTATENGYGKRTPIAEYTRHGRGTKGMIAIQTSERNGKVVAAVLTKSGESNEEIMLISTGGVLIRTRITDIREMSRATQGVTLINLDEGTYLAGLEKVIETEGEEGEGLDGDGAEDGDETAEGSEGADE
jgi:DNA gyrase subunit A